MSNNRKRIYSLFCAIVIILWGIPASVFAQQTVYLRTPNDLLRFSKNCRDEGYSKGLSVALENDIDMGETIFIPIPYFAGSFDGNGYSVRGIHMDFEGSETGFFRRLAEGAKVSGLCLGVNLDLTDDFSSVGGLVGENSGIVSDCVVTGSVRGGEQIGGIVGVNMESGQITSCTNETEVSAEEQTGGVVGWNKGTVSACVNYGNVNNRSKKSDSKGVGALTRLGFHSDEVRLSGHTLYNATGGIAGQNDALIENCTNYGKVGYAHVGNRSGGIAGIQGGKLVGCVNYGAVQGKRNVGGVVGQFVPDADITYGQSKAEHLSDEVSALSSLIQNYGDIVRDENLARDAREIGNALDVIRGHLNRTGADADDRTQELLDVFEEQSDKLQAAIDEMTIQLDQFSESADRDVNGMLDAMEDIRAALSEAEKIKDVAEEGVEKSISPQLDAIDKDMRRAMLSLSDIALELRDVEKLIRDAKRIISRNTALSEMAEELARLFQSFQLVSISDSVREFLDAAEQTERDTARLEQQMQAVRIALSAPPQERQLLLEALQAVAYAEGLSADAIQRQTEERERLIAQTKNVLRGNSAATQKKTQANRLLQTLAAQIEMSAENAAEEQVNLEEQLQRVRALRQRIEREITANGNVGQELQNILARLKEAEKQITELIQQYQKIMQELKREAELIQQALKIVREHADAAAVVGQLSQLLREFDGIQIAAYVSRLSRALEDINRNFQEIRRGISSMSEQISDIVSESWDKIDGSADIMNELAKDFNQATKALSGSMTENVRVVNDAAGIIGDEANQWASETSDSFHSTADFVNEQLDTVSWRLDKITDGAERIGDRFRVNSDTVHDQLSDVKDAAADLGERPVRTMEENSERNFERSKGLVLNCSNEGAVLGDSGVGGIIGAVTLRFGDWDAEEEEKDLENVLLDAEVRLTCMISGCKNTANVTAKKEYAGGVLGKGEHGTIFDCLNTGDITTEEGGLCGGIVGMSDSLIENSSAMGTLSGSEYVGGIAGKGKDIKHCYTMVLIPDSGEKSGAITGGATGELLKNYFIHEELAGVDGVDYPEKAMPLEYEELIAIEAVPDEFRNLTVMFLTDGEVTASYPVSYNQSFDSALIPKVTERDGGYTKWEKFDTEHVRRSLKINLQYVPWTKTISSGGRKPVMLAEGAFTENARLETLEWVEDKQPRGFRVLEGHQFTVWDEGNPMAEQFCARVYNPYGERVKVLVQKDDEWRETEYTTDGSYLVFSTEQSGTFLLARRSKTGLIVSLVLLILLITCFTGYFVMKKHLPYKMRQTA